MLYLLVQLGRDRYAIDAADIEEIIPFVCLKELPGAPPGVAGLVDYYGEAVPVIDLNAITSGERTPARVSARIAMVWCEPSAGERHLIGLLAPRVTELLRCAASSFVAAGMETPHASYLGKVFAEARGIIQLVQPADLLTTELRHAMALVRNAA